MVLQLFVHHAASRPFVLVGEMALSSVYAPLARPFQAAALPVSAAANAR